MSAGYAHIVTLGGLTDGNAALAPQYQFTFTDGNRDFARVFNGPELIDFLLRDLGLDMAVVDAMSGDLRNSGTANIANLTITENEAGQYGLNVVQSEY
jgi:hypothetical protein